jgi:uncharacterized protein (UPF0264 family)
VYLITCIDPRVEPATIVGAQLGEAIGSIDKIKIGGYGYDTKAGTLTTVVAPS